MHLKICCLGASWELINLWGPVFSQLSKYTWAAARDTSSQHLHKNLLLQLPSFFPSSSLFLSLSHSRSLTCRLGANLTLSHLLLNFTGAALSNEAPWCTFANSCLCHCDIIGMWLSMNTQHRVGWPLGDPAESAFVIMEVLSHIIWEWRGIVCRVPGMEMNRYNSLLLHTTVKEGMKFFFSKIFFFSCS